MNPKILALVIASCAAQGLPVKVTDPSTIRKVGTLLGMRIGGRHRLAIPCNASSRQIVIDWWPKGDGRAKFTHGRTSYWRVGRRC